MRNLLVTIPVYDEHRAQLAAAAPGWNIVYDQHPDDAAIAAAEIVFGNLPVSKLSASENLRLVQLNSAGVGNYTELCKPGSAVRVCNASGSYGLSISEHMFGVLLGLGKKLFCYRDQQFDHSWNDLGPVLPIYGANALVIGMGDIGGEFARRLKAFGAHVTGIRRTMRTCPDYCDELGTLDRLDEYLPNADIVFMCLPDTTATRGVIDAHRLSIMKPNAILLNAGRGAAIDTDALVEALKSGKILGAGLDVTDPEPLPPDHPLWDCKNAFITPHISGGYHLRITHDRIVATACANISAYINGGALKNLVQYERGY